jgi:hypothetical protein
MPLKACIVREISTSPPARAGDLGLFNPGRLTVGKAVPAAVIRHAHG